MDNLKVIIFDFDETMYYSRDIKSYYVNYIKKTLLHLTNLDEKMIFQLMKENGFLGDGETRVSFGKNCEKFGVTSQQWNDYRIDNFFEINYENAEILDNEIYDKLSEKYKLYIVSNEVYENVIFKANRLNIDLSNFEICAPRKSNINDYKFTKQDIYKKIIEDNKIDVSQVIVFGDRYNVDILPLENLGGCGVLVKHPQEIFNYLKEMKIL